MTVSPTARHQRDCLLAAAAGWALSLPLGHPLDAHHIDPSAPLRPAPSTPRPLQPLVCPCLRPSAPPPHHLQSTAPAIYPTQHPLLPRNFLPLPRGSSISFTIHAPPPFAHRTGLHSRADRDDRRPLHCARLPEQWNPRRLGGARPPLPLPSPPPPPSPSPRPCPPTRAHA